MDKISNILDHNAFNFSSSDSDQLNTATSKMIKRRLETVGPTSMLFYQEPLHIVRGKGVWLYDNQGKQYLDVYNNVPSIGHCHPKVVDAISTQLRKLNIHSRYLHENIHIYAQRLLATMPQQLERLVMTCTGSESNDLALRLARTYSKRQGIIVTQAAYHGNTSAVTEVSPSALKRGKIPDYVVTIAIDNLGEDPAIASEAFYQSVKNAIEQLDKRGFGCAALLVDTIFSSDGVYSDPKGFLKKAVEWVQKQGGLFIADEVQPGFGRTGDGMWGFERHNVIPDIVTMGKPMGNGYPMSGVASRLDLLDAVMENAGYFNTFGGSAVAAAAGIAVLDVIQNEGVIQRAKSVGRYLKSGLQELQQSYPCIADVRGVGLFLGVEFCTDGDLTRPDTQFTNTLINLLKEDNILIGAAGKHGNSLKIRPPLCFNKTHAKLFLKSMHRILKKCNHS